MEAHNLEQRSSAPITGTMMGTGGASMLAHLDKSVTQLREGWAETHAKSENHDVKVLVLALETLAEEIHRISAQVREERRRDDDDSALQGPFPILEGCQSLLDRAVSEDAMNQPVEVMRDLAASARWYASMLASAARSNVILVHLSLLRPQPSFGLDGIKAVMEADKVAIPEALKMDLDEVDLDVTADLISACLDVFLHPVNDREPHEFHLEQSIVQLRGPGYSASATLWPEFADAFWDEVGPKIIALFSPERRYNFVHWLLEYAKAISPKVYKDGDFVGAALVRLTEAACSGAILPIHVAAALGLPSLCNELITSRHDAQKPGAFGSPLICAMLGTNIFIPLEEGETWLDRDNIDHHGHHNPFEERFKTILLLLASNADRMSDQSWGCLTSPLTMSSLAFWAAYRSRNEAVLKCALLHIQSLEKDLESTLNHAVFLEELDRATRQSKDEEPLMMPSLLTCLLDHHLRLIADGEDDGPPLGLFIDEIMIENDLEFESCDGLELRNVSVEKLDKLVADSILETEEFRVRRLIADPRFTPNKRINSDFEPFLHIAVSGDQTYMVQLLLEAGASLDTRDKNGRSALMVAESTEMMSMLIESRGAKTTDVDFKGRTIWHLLAASNDVVLLKWLFPRDPARDENLTAKTNEGYSPLGEALRYTEELATEPGTHQLPKPHAALALLRECIRGAERSGVNSLTHMRKLYLSNAVPITHLAAVWGSLSFMKSLEAFRADFSELDSEGRSVLHYINFSASAEFIQFIRAASKGVPVAGQNGTTPAEAIFANMRLTDFHGERVKSAHPSCLYPLKREAYEALLTPDVLKFRNNSGEGLWQRFSEAVIVPTMERRGYWEDEALELVENSINTAVRVMIAKGVLSQYENELGVPAIAAFHITTDLSVSIDSMAYFHGFIHTILLLSNDKSKELFKRWPESSTVMIAAVIHNCTGLLSTLRDMGLGVHEPLGKIRDGWTPVEYALTHDYPLSFLRSTLDYTSADELNDCAEAIFGLILETALDNEARAAEQLALLLDNGMDANSTYGGRPLICAAIYRGLDLIVETLIDARADLTLGESGLNALVVATQEANVSVLWGLIESAGKDFPWLSPFFNEDENYHQNLMQLAAYSANAVVLEALLDKVEILKLHIDDASLGNAPVHEAVKSDSVDCLRILSNYGASMSVRGTRDAEASEGFTPLHLAVIYHCSKEVFEFLLAADPTAIHAVDSDGNSPLDLAKKAGDTRVLDMLQKKANVGHESPHIVRNGGSE